MHTKLCVVCLDVNECLKDNGGCDSNRKCINSAGSMKCGDCASGWVNDGDKGCEGLCLLVDCSAEAFLSRRRSVHVQFGLDGFRSPDCER